ncbi:hypothetical protein UPYG_G00325060 [Umbra pygmaea]|uniref:Uncharacterized protein n=1 Tax=Umbra pygmaea TaxID=75934 RepID=A0ABD0W5S4_UMBPY
MTTTTQRVLLCFCSLIAFFSNIVTPEDVGSNNCSSSTLTIQELSSQLQKAIQCPENLTSQWGNSETATVLNSLITLTDILQKNEKAVCQKVEPKECPAALAQSKGGIVCVTINNKRYCKPLCNQGFDFAFLRISRLYEECSKDTEYKWTTQYIGGNKLAVCQKSSHPIAGGEKTYFAKDCLTTKSNSTLENQLVKEFVSQLESKDIKGTPQHSCLICG